MVTIDIINGDRGDLSKWENILFWMDLVAQGLVVLVVGGPPCETWSAAKDPPVRSATQLWGLDRLSPYSRRQVDVGNTFLRGQHLIMWSCNFHDVPALKEHPAHPVWKGPDAPSSWLLPEEQVLYSQPGNTTVTFNTCLLGAPYTKPTTFGAVKFPEIVLLLQQLPNHGVCIKLPDGCNVCGKTHVALKGRAADGHFLTAEAKQYTKDLCNLIARAAILAWARMSNHVVSDMDKAI